MNAYAPRIALARAKDIALARADKAQGFGHSEEVGPERAPVAAEPKPKLRRVAKAMSETERIDQFIRERIRQSVPGKFITSSQLYELFQAWWMSHSPSVPLPSQRALALRMKEAGLVSVKRGGVKVYADAELAAT